MLSYKYFEDQPYIDEMQQFPHRYDALYSSEALVPHVVYRHNKDGGKRIKMPVR